jgi:hypothetical protein
MRSEKHCAKGGSIEDDADDWLEDARFFGAVSGFSIDPYLINPQEPT